MNGKENAECSSASAQRASQTRESIKEEKDVRGIHLMLAEDNELNAEIVKALLEKRGITVDVAQDGRKALKMFKSHGSGTYSLILMDMEKKREQELSVLEVLRLHREFHLPHPVPADEQEKPLDKVKEPPRACRSREREER